MVGLRLIHRYVPSSFNRAFILSLYVNLSITTVALPLSAGRITIELSYRGHKIEERTNKAILKNKITEVRIKKARIEEEIDTAESTLKQKLTQVQWTQLDILVKKCRSQVFIATREGQKKKFQKLKDQYATPPPLDKSKVVVNLSKRNISPSEEDVLSLGLNYAIAPSKLPTAEMIAITEVTARHLDTNTAQKLREGVARVLTSAKPPKPNLTYSQRAALRDLRNDNSIVILPADKGNATVVMDRSTYSDKMNALLKDEGTYLCISRNPTTRVEKQVSEALRSLHQKNVITDSTYKRLNPQYSYPPQMYGLPKIHKEDIPMRPIVAAIGSPTHELAKELTRILSPLVGKTSSFVKNSTDFAKTIRQLRVDEKDMFVSFDVVSLFTKVPITEALTVVSHLLRKDSTLNDRTAIPTDTICSLIELCLRSTFFQFEDHFYLQSEGAAMGSPLSPIIANLYMEYFESLALESSQLQPKLWLRYVDDTFVVWQHGKDSLDSFLDHLNGIRESIKFTMEIESSQTIAFLDVLVKRKEGIISTSVSARRHTLIVT